MQTDNQLQPLTVSITSLETWDMAFAKHVDTLKLAKRSRTLAMQHTRLFAKWYEDEFQNLFDPRAITHFAIMQYREHTLDTLMAATWNSRWWALNILCEWSGCPSAMAGVEQKATVQRSEMHRRLSDPEYRRLHETLERRILSAKSDFEYRNRVADRASVLLMLEAGLRVGEVEQLNKADIHLAERSGHVLVRNGKGSKERKVALNEKVRPALVQWLELRGDENPALFDGKSTLRLSARSLQRIVEDLRADTRIPDLRCHSLRFDFAKRCETRLVKKGWGRGEILRTLMNLLGHESEETTAGYLYSSMDELQSAVEGE